MDSESRSISFETITNAEEFSIKFMALKKGVNKQLIFIAFD